MSAEDRFVLEEIVKQQHQINAPRLSSDKYFEMFSAEQIVKSRGFDLDPTQLTSGVIGDSGDGGVDAIYLFVNRRLIREDTRLDDFKDQQLNIDLLIIQSKNVDTFGETALIRLSDFAENCLRFGADLSKASKTLYRQSLLDAVARFHQIYKGSLVLRPSLTIAVYYATKADSVDGKVEERRSLLETKIREYYSTGACKCELVGAGELKVWFHQTPSATIILETAKSMHWSPFGKSYVCLVELTKFLKFITLNGEPRGHMFEANVRDYHPDATVNQEIGLTLASTGTEEFWWLNNGITIIASEVVGDGDLISVTDPLIVNGLQTSFEIINRFKEAPLFEDKRTILVRVIKATEPRSMDSIIKATNSQTKIPRVWLHATEEIHRNIESVLRGADLYYDRRKNFHRNRGIPPAKIVTIPYLAQGLAAIVLQKPDDARARPTTVAERYYKSLFSDEYPIEMYTKCALIMKRVDDYLDGCAYHDSDRLNLTFYLAMFATCSALRSPKPKRPTIAAMDLGRLTDDLLYDSVNFIYTEYKKLGGDDRTAKGPALAEQLRVELQHRFGRTPGMPEPKPPRVRAARVPDSTIGGKNGGTIKA